MYVPEKVQTECECSEVHQRGGHPRDGPGQNQHQTGSWCMSFLWISIWIYELNSVTIVKKRGENVAFFHVCDLHVDRDCTERKERTKCTSTHWLEIFQSMCRPRSMPWTSVMWESITHIAVSEAIKHMHKQLKFHIKLLKVKFFLYIVTLQRVLDKDQRWWLQVALGCYSIPSSQIIYRDPQWCEYFVHKRDQLQFLFLVICLSVYQTV